MYPNPTDRPTEPTDHPTNHQTITTTGLKAQGKYLARTLSFADTSFQIQQVPLAGEFKAKYDTLAQVWVSARASSGCG